MGIFDKIKKAVSGNKKQIETGIDKAEKVAHDKLPDKFDDKIDMAADKAKDAVEKID